MTDKKFTQKEVIKGLKCCASHVWCKDECPYSEQDECIRKIKEDALDLINRLKTRIVRYQLKNTNQRNALASLNKKVAEQQAEIERLKETPISQDTINGFKADVIKEFAERLKAVSHPYADTQMVFELQIDNLVKEMTEVDK